MPHQPDHQSINFDDIIIVENFNEQQPHEASYKFPVNFKVRQRPGGELEQTGEGAFGTFRFSCIYQFGRYDEDSNQFIDIIDVPSGYDGDLNSDLTNIMMPRVSITDDMGQNGPSNETKDCNIASANDILTYYYTNIDTGQNITSDEIPSLVVNNELIGLKILAAFFTGRTNETELQLSFDNYESSYRELDSPNNITEFSYPNYDLRIYVDEDVDVDEGEDNTSQDEDETDTIVVEASVEEEFSNSFGIDGVNITQTLLFSFAPHSGLDINLDLFQNNLQGLIQSDNDKRIALGMFTFDDENTNSDNSINQTYPPGLDSAYKPNLIQNGSGRFSFSTYQIDTESSPRADFEVNGGNYFIPDGGWGYCTYDGVNSNNRPDDLYRDSGGGQFLSESDAGEKHISTFEQEGSDGTQDSQGVVGYAGYYPYFYENNDGSLLRPSYALYLAIWWSSLKQQQNLACNWFFYMNHYDTFKDYPGQYDEDYQYPAPYYYLNGLFNNTAPETTLGILHPRGNDNDGIPAFHRGHRGRLTSPLVKPKGWGVNAPEYVGWPNFAKWIITDEAFSYNKCLEFLSTDFDVAVSDISGNGWTPTDGLGDLNEYSFSWRNPDSMGGTEEEQILDNQYRSLNQVIEFYRGGDDSGNLLNPYSSLKVSFKMKTDGRFQSDQYQKPEVELAVVDSDGDISNPMRWRDETRYNAYPYEYEGSFYYVGNYKYNKDFVYWPHGDFNSQRYNDELNSPESVDNKYSSHGSSGRFTNTTNDEWEEFSFSFVLGDRFLYNSTKRVKRLFLIVQAANAFYGRVLLDDFKIIESYEFLPEVDVRKKMSVGNYGGLPLTQYYDKEFNSFYYKDTTAPLEAQFYFYPTYPSEEIFDVKRTPIYQDFKKGLFYIYDIDWGDGSPAEFTARPEQINEEKSLYHTYEESGIYEITGLMIRKKLNNDTGKIGEVVHTKKFRCRININEGLDEDFPYFGSDGFLFIPYKNVLPMVGGYSNQSIYYKSIKRQLGFIENEKTFINFKNNGDKLKTEVALLKMENQNDSDLEVLPAYMKQRFNENGNLIYNGILSNGVGTPTITETLGKGIGDCDLTDIKYYNTAKSIWQLFGFSNQDMSSVGNPNDLRYWKNIISEDTSIFDREGIDINGNLQNGTLVVDSFSEQDWLDNSYYPVLPKYNSNGKFTETLDDNGNYIPNSYPNNNIPFPIQGSITDENENEQNLIINIVSEKIDTDVVNDKSGNQNLGFLISDYKINFEETTLKPIKRKRFSKTKTSTKNGAF